MSDGNYTTTFTVHRTPAEVFDAINDVRGWWEGDIQGDTAGLGDVFTYRHGDVHRSTQRITESVPGERIVWHVDDAFLNFTADPAEWAGTTITFDIAPAGDGRTAVTFTHEGLTPQVECYDACSTAWSYYVGESLKEFIAALPKPVA